MSKPDDQRSDLLAPCPGYASKRWSAEKPKAAGRWWWKSRRRDKDAMVLTLFEAADGLCVDTGGILHMQPLLEFLGGWWAGPLPEPLEASDAETRHIDRRSATADDDELCRKAEKGAPDAP